MPPNSWRAATAAARVRTVARFSDICSELKSGKGLDRQRLLRYASILLALELASFAFFAAGTHGLIVRLDKPNTTDFVSFYAAGRLADAGTPWLAYHRAAHYSAEEQVREPGIDYVHFFYPPVFLALCALLARLPYLTAFILFVTLTFIPYAFVMMRILREQDLAVLVPILSFPAVLWTIGFGQNALLTAALFGAATLLVDCRPTAAGLLFGALCYKPQFGLLVPVALAAQRNWRAFAAAAFSATVLSLLSLFVFGYQTWHDFVLAALAAHTAYEGGTVDHAAFVNPFGAVLVLGGRTGLAFAAQAAAMLTCAALVGVVWHKGLSLPARAATLAAATTVAIPVILVYDLVLGAVAGAWLIRAGRGRGFLPWEVFLLVVLFLAPAVSRAVAKTWHLPLGPFASLVLLAIAVAAAWREATGGSSSGMTRRPAGIIG
jgi:hypothetical protein